MEVTKHQALRLARTLFPGRRVLKIEPYFDYDVTNLNDFVSDMCFGKSDVFYYGIVTFNGMFNFWDTYENYSYGIAAAQGKKITLNAGEFSASAPTWDAGNAYKLRSNPGGVQGLSIPVMVWQLDNYHSYQFVGWKITLVSAGPYLIRVSLGGSAVPTADNLLRDVSYAHSGLWPVVKIDTTSFEMISGGAAWWISIRLPKRMATFGANYTLINGTLVSATVDGSYWIAVITGSISSGTLTIQDIS